MKLIYDPQVDAAYMSFTDAKAVDSSEEYDFIIFDYDSDNKVIGIEFLQVSKKHPQLLPHVIQYIYQEFDSIFHSNGKNYDLNKVFAIAHDKRVIQTFLSTLESILNINEDNLGFVDWQRVADTDLQYPIILSIADGGFVIVDGYHRFLKAVTTGEDLVIPTKYITPEELETTRI